MSNEADQTDNAVNLGILSSARKIIAGGLEGLPTLIVDVDSGTIRWPEAFEIFKERLPLYANLDERAGMMYAMADAAEALADTLTFERLDDSIHKAPWRMRLAIGAGLTLARTGLKFEPDKVKELSDEGETLVLQMLNNQQTMQAFIVLSERPRLLTFITKYAFGKLGIPYHDKALNPPEAIISTDAEPQVS